MHALAETHSAYAYQTSFLHLYDFALTPAFSQASEKKSPIIA